MEPPHWTTIGFDLAQQIDGMNKGQRVSHVRTCAASFGLSPHTVRRFVVLAQFAKTLGISGPQATTLPVGTMEIVYRIHDHHPAEAKVALDDLLRGDLSYGDALKRLDKIKASDGDSRGSVPEHDLIRGRIASLLGMNDPADLVEVRSIDSGSSRLSKPTCLFKVGDRKISYVSEATMVAENRRGIRNLCRTVILSACESDIVVVSFMSDASSDGFQKLVGAVCRDVRERIKLLAAA